MKIEIRKEYRSCLDVLSHYECPEACHGSCCGPDIINFSEPEYRHMYKHSPVARRILPHHSISQMKDFGNRTAKFYTFTTHPCPMQNPESRLCSIYPFRPFICRVYPFMLGKGEPEGYVSIGHCRLGLELMKDYTLTLVIGIYKSSQIPEDLKDETVARELETVMPILKDAEGNIDKDRDIKKIVKLMQIPLENMAGFSSFLDANPPESRLHDRKLLGLD